MGWNWAMASSTHAIQTPGNVVSRLGHNFDSAPRANPPLPRLGKRRVCVLVCFPRTNWTVILIDDDEIPVWVERRDGWGCGSGGACQKPSPTATCSITLSQTNVAGSLATELAVGIGIQHHAGGGTAVADVARSEKRWWQSHVMTGGGNCLGRYLRRDIAVVSSYGEIGHGSG
jgi:hypothetical protein